MGAIQISGGTKSTTNTIIDDTVTASGDGIVNGTSVYVPPNPDFKSLSIPETRDAQGNVIVEAQSHEQIVDGMKQNLRSVVAPIVKHLQPVAVSVVNGGPAYTISGTTDILASITFDVSSTRSVLINAVIGFSVDTINTAFTYQPYLVGPNSGSVTGQAYKFTANTIDVHLQVSGSWVVSLNQDTYTLYLRVNKLGGGNIILNYDDIIAMTLMG